MSLVSSSKYVVFIYLRRECSGLCVSLITLSNQCGVSSVDQKVHVDNLLLNSVHFYSIWRLVSAAAMTYRTGIDFTDHASCTISLHRHLSRHIRARSGTRSLRSSAVPFLDVPFRRTDIGKRSFSCAAPATWNSLPPVTVINCYTLSVFKSRLKTHLFNIAYS